MRRIVVFAFAFMILLQAGCTSSPSNVAQGEPRPTFDRLQTIECHDGRELVVGYYIDEPVCRYPHNANFLRRLTSWQIGAPMSSFLSTTVTNSADTGFTMTASNPSQDGNPVVMVCSVHARMLELDRFAVATAFGPAPRAFVDPVIVKQVSIQNNVESIALDIRNCVLLKVTIDLPLQQLLSMDNSFALGYVDMEARPIGQVIKLLLPIPKQAIRGSIPPTTGRFF